MCVTFVKDDRSMCSREEQVKNWFPIWVTLDKEGSAAWVSLKQYERKLFPMCAMFKKDEKSIDLRLEQWERKLFFISLISGRSKTTDSRFDLFKKLSGIQVADLSILVTHKYFIYLISFAWSVSSPSLFM